MLSTVITKIRKTVHKNPIHFSFQIRWDCTSPSPGLWVIGFECGKEASIINFRTISWLTGWIIKLPMELEIW